MGWVVGRGKKCSPFSPVELPVADGEAINLPVPPSFALPGQALKMQGVGVLWKNKTTVCLTKMYLLCPLTDSSLRHWSRKAEDVQQAQSHPCSDPLAPGEQQLRLVEVCALGSPLKQPCSNS